MPEKLEFNKNNVLYDSDETLFFTKIGEKGGEFTTLCYTVWGKTIPECVDRAERLIDLLSKNYTNKK